MEKAIYINHAVHPAALLAILVTSIVASPVVLVKRDKIIIGYRRVSKEQAADYERNGGTLTYDPRLATGGQQLGPGVYISPRRGAWPIGGDSDWADSEAVDNLSKVWVPSFSHDFDNLWYVSEETMTAYIKEVDDGIDPEKAFRLSRIDRDENSLQMLIPPGLLNGQGGGLGITVECDPDANKVPTDAVDYENFDASGDKDPAF
ncbi:hypothetical protein CH35J_011820 [Colletotrichum higginsianum]|uniref:Uncharacterized protein n=1 Tax=Colletotrichum higginsianum TaxID=80884 RepID=A0A4T0VFY6_9PEZI|nr:hypothetical protein CH35J_011820 [Colletotrichum higginsianum]